MKPSKVIAVHLIGLTVSVIFTLSPALAMSQPPREIASVFLAAYRTKNPQEMARYCTGRNLQLIEEIEAQGENHPRYTSIFKGWRWKAVELFTGAPFYDSFPTVSYNSPAKTLSDDT
jgi:hypothetical protein